MTVGQNNKKDAMFSDIFIYIFRQQYQCFNEKSIFGGITLIFNHNK